MRLLWCVGFVALVTIGACRDLTHVEYPDIVQTQANNDSVGAIGRRAGAIITFATAFGYQVVGSDVMADELGAVNGGIPGDQRINIPSQGTGYPFDQLSSSRIDAMRAIQSLQQYAPSMTSQIGELYAYIGYIDVFFSENMCSGVPVGIVTNGVPVDGPTLTRSGLIREALAYFDSASMSATGSDSMQAFAAAGRARALLDSGDFVAAGAAAQVVPAGFRYTTNYAGIAGSVFQPNPIYLYSYFGSVFVSDREGLNGLDFVSAGDPRVLTEILNGFVVPIADTSSTTPILLASGLEAQLIQAESQLHAGNATNAATILNALRQQDVSPPLPAIPADSFATASSQQQIAVLFRERAFWLFLTGHRQGDMRRLIRQYGWPTESVFPTGAYEGGPQYYGTAVVYQPFGESRNPNFQGCLDMSA
jgi:starch-binding outer membrane protein, SusD/RagB family